MKMGSSMERYKNLSDDSGVAFFEIGIKGPEYLKMADHEPANQ
jgi:hypothetical protein